MDSACCNHMTPHSYLFSQLEPASHPLNICITNGSTMFNHNVGSISTSNLSVPRVFNVPNLSYNSFSVGQLAELGYRFTFDYSWCIVQDPRIGQELGIDPKVGRMFPMDNLCLPPIAPVSVAVTAAVVSFIHSLAIWHARFGRTSSSRGEAALHAVHAINRILSPVIQNQTLYECLFGSPPDYHHIRSLGFACFVLLQPHEHNKLEPQSKFYYFIGYGKTQKGHRCYDLVSHHLRISQNVVF
nr:hypothetical protein CFP56_07050 [Quercus suber]